MNESMSTNSFLVIALTFNQAYLVHGLAKAKYEVGGAFNPTVLKVMSANIIAECIL